MAPATIPARIVAIKPYRIGKGAASRLLQRGDTFAEMTFQDGESLRLFQRGFTWSAFRCLGPGEALKAPPAPKPPKPDASVPAEMEGELIADGETGTAESSDEAGAGEGTQIAPGIQGDGTPTPPIEGSSKGKGKGKRAK